MRKIQYTLIALLLATSTLYSQCNPFYNFKEGSQWEITNYGSNDKITSRQVNEVTSLKLNPSGWEASLKMQNYDKKDKLDFEKEISMGCDNGVISLDMSRFFPEEMLKSFKDMDMKIETENLEIPSDLEVGQELKEASLTISGNIPFTMETRIKDRKVLSKEKITTPAGTFECFKISYTVVSKTVMSMEYSTIDWIAKEVGMVKSESYAKNGKLNGYSLLTSFK